MTSEGGASELRWQAGQLWPAMRKVWILAVLSGLLSLSPTVYMMEVYGRVITSRSEATLAWLTLAVVAVYAGMELLNWVVGEIMHHAGRGFEERLAPKVLERVFASALNNSSGASQQPLLDLRTLREFVYSPGFLAALEAPVALVFLHILEKSVVEQGPHDGAELRGRQRLVQGLRGERLLERGDLALRDGLGARGAGNAWTVVSSSGVRSSSPSPVSSVGAWSSDAWSHRQLSVRVCRQHQRRAELRRVDRMRALHGEARQQCPPQARR